jgi:hypothetical protein
MPSLTGPQWSNPTVKAATVLGAVKTDELVVGVADTAELADAPAMRATDATPVMRATDATAATGLNQRRRGSATCVLW